MLSIDSEDEELRSAAYDLLGAVCSYLGYDKNPVVASKGNHIVFVSPYACADLTQRVSSPEILLPSPSSSAIAWLILPRL
jgi:hypothetical protein